MRNATYTVVENAGYIGECDIKPFTSNTGAWAYIAGRYTKAERGEFSNDCLHVDVRMDWTDAGGEEHSEYGN